MTENSAPDIGETLACDPKRVPGAVEDFAEGKKRALISRDKRIARSAGKCAEGGSVRHWLTRGKRHRPTDRKKEGCTWGGRAICGSASRRARR